MGRRLLQVLAVALGASVGQADALNENPTGSAMEVRKLHVECLSETEIRVRGEVRCIRLKPPSRVVLSPDSNVEINVDFPRGEAGFAALPERFRGLPITQAARDAKLWTAHYEHRGGRYKIGQKKLLFYNPTELLRPAVLDRRLDNDTDDGRWISFDKTLTFTTPLKGMRYRVVIGWKLSHISGFAGDPVESAFAHFYFWAVYGSFSWGDAPACDKTLRATYRRPVFFTPKGVVTREPVARALEQPKKPEERRPALVRSGERPTQLDAANASEKLGNKLGVWPQIDSVGAMANPFVATVNAKLASGLKPGGAAAFVAELAVETAYAFPWVKSVNLLLENPASTITMPWDDVAKFTAAELTLADFHKRWKITGAPIPPPPK